VPESFQQRRDGGLDILVSGSCCHCGRLESDVVAVGYAYVSSVLCILPNVSLVVRPVESPITHFGIPITTGSISMHENPPRPNAARADRGRMIHRGEGTGISNFDSALSQSPSFKVMTSRSFFSDGPCSHTPRDTDEIKWGRSGPMPKPRMALRSLRRTPTGRV
jgi:hypothetical protein